MKITYRRWQADDIEHVQRILVETWLHTYSGLIPRDDFLCYLDEHYNIYALKELVGDPDTVGFIAEVENSAAGYEKTFYYKEERRLYVQQLYILPQYQGMGIGTQLMKFAAERAKTFDLDRVWLRVMADNSPALLWYQKMGFQITEKEPLTIGKTSVDHYIGYVPLDKIFLS